MKQKTVIMIDKEIEKLKRERKMLILKELLNKIKGENKNV